MASLISKALAKVKEANGGKSLFKIFTSLEAVKMLADGNVGFMKLIHPGTTGKNSTLVGQDLFGNKYYEDNSLAYGRKRWVVYSDTFNYNPTSIPPEWHGWINYVNDFAPTQHQYTKPKYCIEAYQTRTGTMTAYAPKGAYSHNQLKRTWKKYEAWQPPKSS